MYFEEGEGEDDLGPSDGIVSPKLSATRSVRRGISLLLHCALKITVAAVNHQMGCDAATRMRMLPWFFALMWSQNLLQKKM